MCHIPSRKCPRTDSITKISQLYEVLSGERLFDPSFQTEELGLTMEESHLIQIIELFGAFPLDLLNAGRYSSRWFSESGMLMSLRHTLQLTILILIRRTAKIGDELLSSVPRSAFEISVRRRGCCSYDCFPHSATSNSPTRSQKSSRFNQPSLDYILKDLPGHICRTQQPERGPLPIFMMNIIQVHEYM